MQNIRLAQKLFKVFFFYSLNRIFMLAYNNEEAIWAVNQMLPCLFSRFPYWYTLLLSYTQFLSARGAVRQRCGHVQAKPCFPVTASLLRGKQRVNEEDCVTLWVLSVRSFW